MTLWPVEVRRTARGQRRQGESITSGCKIAGFPIKCTLIRRSGCISWARSFPLAGDTAFERIHQRRVIIPQGMIAVTLHLFLLSTGSSSTQGSRSHRYSEPDGSRPTPRRHWGRSREVGWGHGLTALLAFPTAGSYVRLFIIQHDCGCVLRDGPATGSAPASAY